VYVPKLKYCVSSKQKKMIGEPFQIPEKARVETFACRRSRHAECFIAIRKPDRMEHIGLATDVMHNAPPAAATHTARRASI